MARRAAPLLLPDIFARLQADAAPQHSFSASGYLFA